MEEYVFQYMKVGIQYMKVGIQYMKVFQINISYDQICIVIIFLHIGISHKDRT